MMRPPDWRSEAFTVAQVAKILHLSPSTTYRMVRDGILAPSISGLGAKKTMLIPRTEVEHYINSLRTAARRKVEEASNG